MSNGTERRQRFRHLTIRLNLAERLAIEQAAERAGLMVGSYARQVLFGAPMPRQVRRPPIERRELARLLGEVGRIGNNHNQIAKAMNSGVLVYDNEMNAAARAIIEMRDALMKALGRMP